MWLCEILLSVFMSAFLSVNFIEEKLRLSQEWVQLEHEEWVGFLAQEACFAREAGRWEWLNSKWKERVATLLPQGKGRIVEESQDFQVRVNYTIGSGLQHETVKHCSRI